MHHHAWTIIKETDLEIQTPRPVTLWRVLIEFPYLGSTVSLWAILFLHSLGIVSKEAMKVVPKSEWQKMLWSHRACLALHLVLIVVAIAVQSWLPNILFHSLAKFRKHVEDQLPRAYNHREMPG